MIALATNKLQSAEGVLVLTGDSLSANTGVPDNKSWLIFLKNDNNQHYEYYCLLDVIFLKKLASITLEQSTPVTVK